MNDINLKSIDGETTSVHSSGQIKGANLSFVSISENGVVSGKLVIRGESLKGLYVSSLTIYHGNQTITMNVNIDTAAEYYTIGTIILHSGLVSSDGTISIYILLNGNNTFKSNTISVKVPTKEQLNNIDINVTHNETNPPSVLTDNVSLSSSYLNYGNIYYTLDGSIPSRTNGTKYLGAFTVPNNVENNTIKIIQICSDVSSDVITKTIEHTKEEDVPKRYKVPTIRQNGYYVVVTNNYEIQDNDNLKVELSERKYPYRVFTADISKDVNEVRFNQFKADTRCRARIVNKDNASKDYSLYSNEIDFVYPVTPPITIIKPIINSYTKVVNGETKYYISFFKPEEETHDYTKIYYTLNDSIPDEYSSVTTINEEIEIIPDLIVKAYAYYFDVDRNESYVSDIVTKQIVYKNDDPYYTGYAKPDLNNKVIKNYVDIIYSRDVESTKSLESIQYILDVINKPFGTINLAEQAFARLENHKDGRYSGDYLVLYSDETYSGEININDKGDNNIMDNYKYPTFQKGHWEFNNFRNGGTQLITADELNKIYTNIPYIDSNGKTIIASITLNDLYKSFGITSTESSIALRSDNRSLIYGKYIVARFIFNNDKKIKLQNVTFITNNY